MKNIMFYYCVFVIAAGLALIGCEMPGKEHPPDSGLVLLFDGVAAAEDDYVFPQAGPYTITVTVENTRSTATGELTITTDGAAGSGWQHFSVSPATLGSIAANASADFTITVNNTGAYSSNNAQIRIDDPGFRKTAHVYYIQKPPLLNREDFYGDWANSSVDNGSEIQWNSFRYYNISSGVNINVTSRILDWTEETFVIQNFGLSGIPAGQAAQPAYKLTCQVTYIASYTGANFDMSAVFGLVTESLSAGHKFDVWVFPRSGGIHLGMRRDNQNKTPWVVFMPR